MENEITFEGLSEQVFLDVRRWLANSDTFRRWLERNAVLFGGHPEDVQLLLAVEPAAPAGQSPWRTLRLLFPRFYGSSYITKILGPDLPLDTPQAMRHAHAQMNYSFEMGIDPLEDEAGDPVVVRGFAYASLWERTLIYHHDADSLGTKVYQIGRSKVVSANPEAHQHMGIRSFLYVPVPQHDPQCLIALYCSKSTDLETDEPTYNLPYPDWAGELWGQPFFQVAIRAVRSYDQLLRQHLLYAVHGLASTLDQVSERSGSHENLFVTLCKDLRQDPAGPRVDPNAWEKLKSAIEEFRPWLALNPEMSSLPSGSKDSVTDPVYRSLVGVIIENWLQLAFPPSGVSPTPGYEPDPLLELKFKTESPGSTNVIYEVSFSNKVWYTPDMLKTYWAIRQARVTRPPNPQGHWATRQARVTQPPDPKRPWGGYGLLLARLVARQRGLDFNVRMDIPPANSDTTRWSVIIRCRN